MPSLTLLRLGVISLIASFLTLSLGAQETPISRAKSHGPSCGESCAHQTSAPLASRRVILNSPPGWERAKKGEQIDLGFEITGLRRATLNMIGKGPEGIENYGLELADGGKLSIGRRGDLWEGTLLSANGDRGWRLKSVNGVLEITEYNYEDLICARRSDGQTHGGLPPVKPVEGSTTAADGGGVIAEVSPQASFESLPGAPYVLYLDFDGETVSGTSWNSQFNGGADIIASEPAGLTTADVELIWRRVAEDYRPFNVNVTTNRSIHNATAINRRGMVIFTSNDEWYNAVGGVAYVGSFAQNTSDNPSWVFSDNLGTTNKAANCHEAASHEAGHMFGLRHDGTDPNLTTDYYSGHSNSPIPSWGPIMGVCYNVTVGQWSIGEYTVADNFEDDTAIIAGVLGYLPDDHANSTGGASPAILVSDTISATGLIERRSDVDVFTFQTSGGAVSISAQPFFDDPNLDIRMRLLNSSGTQLVDSNQVNVLSAQINATLNSGIYYLEISGVGTGDPTTGWSDYGSLGGYTISGTVPSSVSLLAEITSPTVAKVSLPEGTGLVLDSLTNGNTTVWEITSAPAGGNVTFSNSSNSSTRATFNAPGSYEIRLRTSNGSAEVSDLIEVLVEPYGATAGYNQAPEINLGSNRVIYAQTTTLTPIVNDNNSPLTYVWSVLTGDGQLSDTSVENPNLAFPTASSSLLRLVVGDGSSRVFQEVTLTASYQAADFLGTGSTASVTNATSTNFSTNWKMASYTPSGWISGSLGAGFDVTSGNAAKKIYLPLIGSGLNFNTVSLPITIGYLMRVPFTVDNASNLLSLQLDMQYDDGFVAYINGVEVARDNIIAIPSYNSAAQTDRPDEEGLSPLGFVINLSNVTLVNGTNTLAIHGMNTSTTTNGNGADQRFLLLPCLKGIISNAPSSTFTSAVAVITDLSQRGEDNDPDGDGRSNLEEYAAGTSLNSAELGYPMVDDLSKNGFNIILPDAPPGDVRYIVEHNTNLVGSWTILAQKVGGNSWTGTSPPTAGIPAAESRESFTFSIPPGDRGFVRLRFVIVSP